jgi:hypothetical protein
MALSWYANSLMILVLSMKQYVRSLDPRANLPIVGVIVLLVLALVAQLEALFRERHTPASALDSREERTCTLAIEPQQSFGYS